MSGFGDRFNAWLIKQGKTPLTDEEIRLMNESGNRVAAKMRADQDKIVKQTCDFMAALTKLHKKHPL